MESAEDKVNKPSDNVITSEQKPSTPTSTLITLGLLTIGLLFASLYLVFSILSADCVMGAVIGNELNS